MANMRRFNGSKLHELRNVQGLSIPQLAESSGLSEQAIRDLEAGKTKMPRPRTVKGVARVLGCGPEDLYDYLDTALSPEDRREALVLVDDDWKTECVPGALGGELATAIEKAADRTVVELDCEEVSLTREIVVGNKRIAIRPADGTRRVVVKMGDRGRLRVGPAGSLLLTGLELRGREGEQDPDRKDIAWLDDDQEGSFLIRVEGGTCTLRDLTIRFASTVAVDVTDGAQTELDLVSIEQAGFTAVLARSNANVVLRMCNIAFCDHTGVIVRGRGTRVVCRRSTISESRGEGLRVENGAQLEFCDSSCACTNRRVGIQASGGARLSMTDSVAASNDHQNVMIRGGSVAEIEGCVMADSGWSSVWVLGEGSSARLIDSLVETSRANALVAATNDGTVELIGCDLSDSGDDGLYARNGGKVYCRSTVITDAHRYGIVAVRGVRCEVEGSRIFGSGGYGVFVGEDSNVEVSKSKIRYSALNGVRILARANFSYCSTSISDNGQEPGILADPDSKVFAPEPAREDLENDEADLGQRSSSEASDAL